MKFDLIFVEVISFIVVLLFSSSTISALDDISVQNLFFISYDETCNDNRNILEVLEETDAFSGNSIDQFERSLNEIIETNNQDRPVNSYNVPTIPNHSKRRLYEMSWRDRRDQLIAAFDTLLALNSREVESSPTFRTMNILNKTSASVAFLQRLAIDIIDDGLLPNNTLFKLSKSLPCAKFAPERNAKRFPLSVRTPNDYNSSLQWYLDDPPVGIGAVSAWKCYTGQSDGPTVGVLDTGCSQHPDLERNLCQCDDDCRGFDMTQQENPYNEPESSQHGTAVSGLVAAVGNNGRDVTGVCWGCKISCYKRMISPGSFDAATVLKLLEHLIGNSVRISNHSYTAFDPLQSEKHGFDLLEKAGHLVIIAAGNESCDLDNLDDKFCTTDEGIRFSRIYPIDYGFSNFFVVGASNRHNEMVSFSNFGKKVDLFAPGHELAVLANTKFNSNSVSFISGTSFAAPLVSGAVALLWGHDPTLTASEVKDLILTTARQEPAFSDKCKSGGILNLAAAMEQLSERKACMDPHFIEDIRTPRVDNTEMYYQGASCNSAERKQHEEDDEDDEDDEDERDGFIPSHSQPVQLNFDITVKGLIFLVFFYSSFL